MRNLSITAALLFFGLAQLALADEQDFFKGKVIHVIVGSAPGGGFDTYSRTIARHIGKHIPGNPPIIVDNMPVPVFSSRSIIFTTSPSRMVSRSATGSALW